MHIQLTVYLHLQDFTNKLPSSKSFFQITLTINLFYSIRKYESFHFGYHNNACFIFLIPKRVINKIQYRLALDYYKLVWQRLNSLAKMFVPDPKFMIIVYLFISLSNKPIWLLSQLSKSFWFISRPIRRRKERSQIINLGTTDWCCIALLRGIPSTR